MCGTKTRTALPCPWRREVFDGTGGGCDSPTPRKAGKSGSVPPLPPHGDPNGREKKSFGMNPPGGGCWSRRMGFLSMIIQSPALTFLFSITRRYQLGPGSSSGCKFSVSLSGRAPRSCPRIYLPPKTSLNISS